MKLKALCTIIGADDKRAAPNEVFDSEDFKIGTKEIEVLIATGRVEEAADKAAEPTAKPLSKAEQKAAEKAAAEAEAAEKEAADKAASNGG